MNLENNSEDNLEELKKETALVEAILFLEGEAINETGISRISGLGRETVEKALLNLRDRYASDDSGLSLSRIGEGFVISPKKAY